MGRRCKDYTGEICGVWEVIERDWNPSSKSHETFWKAKCTKCGEISSVRKTDLDRKPRSCNKCKGAVIQQVFADKGMTIYKTEIGMRFGRLVVDSRSFLPEGKTHSYCWCNCDCGNRVLVRTDHLHGNGRGSRTVSCGCATVSSGEMKLAQLLDSMGIEYQTQYTIPEFSLYSRFDVAILEGGKLKGLIEYDGEQHFKPVAIFGGEEKFRVQQERDSRKNAYCKEHNIPLVRIPYTDYDVLSEEYLNSRISRF
jgi:hypothetical protein